MAVAWQGLVTGASPKPGTKNSALPSDILAASESAACYVSLGTVKEMSENFLKNKLDTNSD